jgi:Flp pilus assembly pilin Flp
MNTMLLKLYVKFQDLMNREEGQDLVEYALVLALITVGAVAILTSIGGKVVGTLTAINSAL